MTHNLDLQRFSTLLKQWYIIEHFAFQLGDEPEAATIREIRNKVMHSDVISLTAPATQDRIHTGWDLLLNSEAGEDCEVMMEQLNDVEVSLVLLFFDLFLHNMREHIYQDRVKHLYLRNTPNGEADTEQFRDALADIALGVDQDHESFIQAMVRRIRDIETAGLFLPNNGFSFGQSWEFNRVRNEVANSTIFDKNKRPLHNYSMRFEQLRRTRGLKRTMNTIAEEAVDYEALQKQLNSQVFSLVPRRLGGLTYADVLTLPGVRVNQDDNFADCKLGNFGITLENAHLKCRTSRSLLHKLHNLALVLCACPELLDVPTVMARLENAFEPAVAFAVPADVYVHMMDGDGSALRTLARNLDNGTVIYTRADFQAAPQH